MGCALVFDSGIGGLSVADHMRRLMPDLTLIYVADDEFRPYGSKTSDQLRARLPGLLRTLEIAINPDIIVIACNTASTAALSEIRAAVVSPVVGVVPAIKPAAEQSQTKIIGVLGTPGTVERDYVNDLAARFASDCAVILQGSTQLVEQAERKLDGRGVDNEIVRAEIAPIFASPNVDKVVLACTHFPVLVDELTAVAPYPVTWVDSGAAIARRCQDLMRGNERSDVNTQSTALLIGPDAGPERRKAFAHSGFERVVVLAPNR